MGKYSIKVPPLAKECQRIGNDEVNEVKLLDVLIVYLNAEIARDIDLLKNHPMTAGFDAYLKLLDNITMNEKRLMTIKGIKKGGK
jgi:hypothetical protein